MTDGEKHLLLKDLCARLPYGVICKTEKGNGHLCSINQTFFGIEYGVNISSLKRDYFDDINTDEQVVKPYLRPRTCYRCNRIKHLLIMKQTDVNYQKLTGEWNKHIRKRKGLKKLYNKKRRAFLKKCLIRRIVQNIINGGRNNYVTK